jgi:hypothetical protein
MVRIRLKYLVPICGLGLTTVLILAGYQEQHHREEVWGPPSSWDGPPPRGIETATAVNAPAVLAAVPGLLVVAFTTHILDRESLPWWADALIGTYFSIFVLAQWILIGRWIERHQKLRSPTPAGPVGLVLINVLGIAVSLGCLWLGIDRIKHSGWMSTWIPGAGVVVWSLVALTVLSLRLRRVLAFSRRR